MADFNHDGKLDIVSVMDTVNNPSTLGVEYLAALLGDGTGSSANPDNHQKSGALTAALKASPRVTSNGDGLPDVRFVTGPALENSQVYLNTGNGTFSPGATVDETARSTRWKRASWPT